MPILRAAAIALLTALPVAAQADDLDQFRSIYRELVEINTTDSVGDTHRAAEAMAARLKAGGLPAADVQVFQTAPRKGDMVARLRGTGARKPILLMAHIDVVEAPREDWATDPFKLVEENGVFHARGSIDDKAMAAIFTDTLIRLHQEHFTPDRDIVLALTTDEELSDSPYDGARFLVEQHRDLIDAAFALNEGGGGALKDGKPVRMSIQLAEKIYRSYRLEVKDRGGHSALPRRETAINVLAAGLLRLARFDFPAHLNPVTRGYFERVAPTEEPSVAAAIKALLAGSTDEAALRPLAERAGYNAQMRTTCVTTLLQAGEVENALPQDARATVNCRILPDEAVDDVVATLVKALDDPRITVTPIGKAVLSPPSPLDPEVMRAVEGLIREMWPGVPLIPTMSGGYTDSRWLRGAGIPAYGLSGLFVEPETTGVHGRNEQVPAKALYDSRQFLYRLVKSLSAAHS
jgi:acetylornithine deacetylase/succinyl-diaminopimelate desuccinylase-like protein